jgi:hypothetical protein
MRERGVPAWLYGVLAGLLLIIVVRSCLGSPEGSLRGQLAPRPGDPAVADLPLPDVSLDALPQSVRNAQATALALLGNGEAVPALTPTAEGAGLRVRIDALRRTDTGVQVTGELVNTGSAPRSVPPEALLFRDSAGQLYAISGPSAEVGPNAGVAIDMTVPVAADSGLTLIVDLPPDPPLQLVLLAAQG